MKIIIKAVTFAFISLAFLTAATAQRAIDSDLIRVLALGKLHDLNLQHTTWQKDLLIRLYEVPIFENDCFVETHGVCQNEYFLTVSTIDEYPEINIFNLGQKGELIAFEWLEENKVDYVEISFSFRNIRLAASKNNPDLSSNNFAITAKIGINNLTVIKN